MQPIVPEPEHLVVFEQLASVKPGPVGKGVGSLAMHGKGHGHRGPGKKSGR